MPHCWRHAVPDDKDAIRELLHRYCFCMDEGRFAELAALFTADGEWIAPYRSAKGPADIAAWLQRSNYLVMVEGPNGPIASVCGVYDDTLVKQRDGWRFERRQLIHAFKGEMALRLP